MNYLSVCSGIEAASVAWHPLGWNAFAYSEIEKFPCEVLKHHYSQTPNFGDMTKFKEWPDANINVLVGGTPCQSFSIAGLRKGLDDPRGNLMLTYLAIADKYRPEWLLWENVPGVLSSNGGWDFGALLGGLGKLGYGFAYRVLDAQYFGVPQRRRRVFVVANIGSWQRAAAVLFERHSLQGNPAPSKGERQEITGTLTRGFGDRGYDLDQIAGGAYALQRTCSGKDNFGTLMANCGTKQWLGNQEALSGDYHVFAVDETAQTLTKSPSSYASYNPARQEGNAVITAYALAGNIIGRKPENGGNGDGYSEDVSYTLTKTDVHAVAFNAQGSSSQGDCVSEHVTPTLDKSKVPAVMHTMRVRRLMPIECERLQGFPDNYTNIPGASDSARYKALGNSMAVPVMHWIGKRIEMVNAIADIKAVA